ncbi:MAG: response regulator, partial [Deltaproteobacteria bacterium]|nr:response regulator [Deltaproteobacteria bacterium]
VGLFKRNLAKQPGHLSSLTVGNAEEAMEAIKGGQIGIVVTELRLPGMGGAELVDWINENHPTIPCIILSAFVTPSIEERMRDKGVFKVLKKPLDHEKLSQAVISGLNQVVQSKTQVGISVSSFLQLLTSEQRTCMVEVFNSEGKRALVYVDKGDLMDAVYGTLKGEAAVLHLLGWDLVQIRFRRPPAKRVKKNIYQGLMPLLLEAAAMDEETRAREHQAQSKEPEKAKKSAAESEAVKPRFKVINR